MKASGSEIPARLKIARASFNLNQKEFASQSGVGFSTYQKYEMGMSVPGGEAIEGFMRLGISANWLLTGEGEMLISEGRDAAETLLDPNPDDRLRMLQMVLRMSEIQLKDPPTPDVAKKVIDLTDAWSPFAAKFPDLKERLDTLKATASFFI